MTTQQAYDLIKSMNVEDPLLLRHLNMAVFNWEGEKSTSKDVDMEKRVISRTTMKASESLRK